MNFTKKQYHFVNCTPNVFLMYSTLICFQFSIFVVYNFLWIKCAAKLRPDHWTNNLSNLQKTHTCNVWGREITFTTITSIVESSKIQCDKFFLSKEKCTQKMHLNWNQFNRTKRRQINKMNKNDFGRKKKRKRMKQTTLDRFFLFIFLLAFISIL